MNKYLTLIFLVGLIGSGCATTNTASNRDILMAINKQSEAITNLTVAIRTPSPVPATTIEGTVKKSSSGLGYSLTAADLHPTNIGTKTSTERSTLFPKKNSADTDIKIRLRKLEKKVSKLEKSDKQQNRRLAAIETKIDALDITAYSHIVFSEFFGNKLNKKVIGQIKQDTAKFNERTANDEENVTYQIDVTAYDNKGRYSKKKTQVFADELKKHLSTSFSVNTKESSNIDARLANRAKINVPF